MVFKLKYGKLKFFPTDLSIVSFAGEECLERQGGVVGGGEGDGEGVMVGGREGGEEGVRGNSQSHCQHHISSLS